MCRCFSKYRDKGWVIGRCKVGLSLAVGLGVLVGVWVVVAIRVRDGVVLGVVEGLG